jgi:hypothetical protein
MSTATTTTTTPAAARDQAAKAALAALSAAWSAAQDLLRDAACGPTGHVSQPAPFRQAVGLPAQDYHQEQAAHAALRAEGLKAAPNDRRAWAPAPADSTLRAEARRVVEAAVYYLRTSPLAQSSMDDPCAGDVVVVASRPEGGHWVGVLRGRSAMQSSHSPWIDCVQWIDA